MPDHAMDESAGLRFEAFAGGISQCGRGFGNARFIRVQAASTPNQLGMTIHETRHDHASRGIYFLRSVRQRQILHPPAGSYFDYPSVFDQQRAVADDAEFLKSRAASGIPGAV